MRPLSGEITFTDIDEHALGMFVERRPRFIGRASVGDWGVWEGEVIPNKETVDGNVLTVDFAWRGVRFLAKADRIPATVDIEGFRDALAKLGIALEVV